ncbi:endoglucanase, partial [Streptomyces sp. NPDC055078]
MRTGNPLLHTGRPPRRRRPMKAPWIAIAALLLAAGFGAAGPALAADPGEATGPTGQKLTVSDTRNIDPAGQKVTVTGSGYALDKGVYLAVCALPDSPRDAPSPCLGGMDLSGVSGSSYWISNNPPDSMKDLVKPFTVRDGKGGFTLELTVKAKDSGADCSQRACAVVTRADHTHSGDREQDVIVPVTFGSGGGVPTPEVPPGTVRHDEVRRFTPAAGGLLQTAVDPAEGRLYVTSRTDTRNVLTTYDTRTGNVIGTPVDLPGVATTLALDADSRVLHLGLGDRIATYDTQTGRVTDHRTPPLADTLLLLAADPGADRLYLSTQDRKLSVYDTKTWKPVGEPVALPFPPGGLAVDTRTHTGYAVYVGGARDPGTGQTVFRNVLNAIDGATGKLTGTLDLGTTPLGSRGVAIDSGTGTGYVANIGVGTVFTIDLRANKVTGTVAVGGGPKNMAVDTGTGTLYVAQTTAGTVAVVDTARQKVAQTLETGNGPETLALDDRNHTLFTLSRDTGEVVQTQRHVSPAVTTAPKAATVRAGERAEFTAAADGTPAPTTTWEVSTDKGASWQPVAGSAGSALTFKATLDHDGNRYRAVFSNLVGSTRSAPVELAVTPAPGPSPSTPGPGPDPGPDPSGGGDSTGGSGSTDGGSTSGSGGAGNSGGPGGSAGTGGTGDFGGG